ncbi:hypothetical protein HN371_20280 [Candidatus Poribacteria bacterium]|jgi:hypothetical protein|nr:hypothetical protein [Candidatus Poribacteria bacterium]MBT5709618.1 hypothetical protein [Candidatus Poribacteria bacterium]MBT7096471.1 hypothetical protein [Candidatus Poribacteria bacterium]MBT7804125.1 hypothetical protein [Candidatus Poribacteria bacterium]
MASVDHRDRSTAAEKVAGLADGSAIRARAVVLIVLLIPLNCWWTAMAILRVGISATSVSLFFPAITTILLLVGFHALARVSLRGRPTLFTRAEILAIYTCVSIGVGISGADRMYDLVTLLGHGHWFATAENDWAGLFLRFVPEWLTVQDETALKGWYGGASTLYTARNLRIWAPVILRWSAFIVALHVVMLGANLVIRRQWVETERLSYPVIQLPQEMSNLGGGFFRGPWLWIGVGIGAAIDIVNGLNYLYPSVPSLGGKLFDLQLVFKEKPWNAIGWSPMGVFPFAVGMSFFIPLDLAFSCWAFWLIWRAERVLFAMIGASGVARGGTISYESEQSHGAYIGLCLLAIWMSRDHLKHAFRQVVQPTSGGSDGEAFRYRTMTVLMVVAAVFIAVFWARAGMSAWVIILYFTIWMAISFAITRLRAELGSPVHDLHFIGPDEILPRLFGVRRLGGANLTTFSYLYFLNRAHRAHIMPHQLEGMRLAHTARSPLRRLTWLMLLASVVGVLSAFWAYVSMAYWEGGWQRGWESFRRLERWMTNPTPPDGPALAFVSFGVLLTLALAALRMRYIWWELHPVGYAISGSWAINPMIGSIFVGWLLKLLILKFGGIRMHRASTPLFLGLILGEFVLGAFWSVLGIALKLPTYRFLF